MAKNKNMKIQLNNMVNEKLAIGESRHEAKQDYAAKMNAAGEAFNVAKSDKIHSIKTADTYREVINGFANWIRSEKPDLWKTKDLGQISKEVAFEYLKGREDSGLSAWTISRDMAGINKVLDLGLTKAQGGLRERKLSDIKRSRGDTNANLTESLKNENRDQIILAKGTGIRRESVTEMQPKSFVFDKDGNPVGVRVEWEKDGKMQYEKGGRFRISPVLKEYQSDLARILKDKDPEKPIFKEYSSKIDNHAFRGEYASKRYQELRESKLDRGETILSDYRGYDRSIIKEISANLGHNRESVVVEFYLK